MRIAYVITQDRGGPVDVVVSLAREMASSGPDEVRVFGPTPARCDAEFRHLLDECSVDSKFDVSSMRRMRRRIVQWAPDVVHTHDRRAMLVVNGRALSRRSAIRRVATYHGVPSDVTNEWFHVEPGATGPSVRTRVVLAAEAVMMGRLDRLVVPSRGLRRFAAVRLGLPESKVEVIDNGVPFRAPAPVDPPIHRLLYVGVLVERKGLRELVEAVGRLRAEDVDLELCVAGSGPLLEELQRRAETLGLAGCVHFLGFRSEIRDLMTTADAVVLPSGMEQQPLAIIEAMMAGKLVLATRVGGVEEMFDGVDAPGALVPPGDVGELADGLRLLLATDEPAAVGARYAATAQARFDVRATAETHRRLYRALTSRAAA